MKKGVLGSLFFARSDIQEIITDYSLIDPCNPDKTSQDIFNEYVNNCYKNFWWKELKDILGDIAEKMDIIIPDSGFKSCIVANCMFEKIKELKNDYFCKLIKGIDKGSSLGISIWAENIKKTRPHVDGYAIWNMKNNVKVEYDLDFCAETDFLKIAFLIIHELLHAEFKLFCKNEEKG